MSHVLTRRIRDALAAWEMTSAQYTALSVLDHHGQLSNAQLAERSLVSPPAANEMVKLMEARGWVARESAASHGRIIYIRLTPEGETLLRQCDAAVVQVERALLAELDESQYGPLHAQLRLMLRGLNSLVL